MLAGSANEGSGWNYLPRFQPSLKFKDTKEMTNMTINEIT